jgi:dihydroorotase
LEKHPADTTSGNILIKQVKIACPGSEHNNRITDILISEGKIVRLGDINEVFENVIDASGCIAAPALFDLRARHGEPGLEQNEDVESLINASSAGGFSAIATLPDTQPCISSRAQIEFLKNKSKNKLVTLYPLGATTLDLEGKELAELYDMSQGGALGFSNADHAYNTGALQRALLYVKPFEGLIFSHAEDCNLSKGGYVNESNNTADLGLKHFPAHAEYSALAHEIEIARYTDSKIHFSHLSSSQSVDLVRKAKKEGLHVTCDVSILHLIYNDQVLRNFDSNFKLMPPLRNESDRLALVEGINDGTIDCIVSDHNPQCTENKLVEFNYSPFGAITIQMFFSLYCMHLSNQISLSRFIDATAIAPRKILALVQPEIRENAEANLAIFNPDLEWEFNQQSNFSRSSNSHLFNQKLIGKCLYLFHNNQFAYF